MSTLSLCLFPQQEQLLHTPSKPVTHFDTALHTFTQQLINTMYTEQGIGLAAVQVGQLQQIFVMDVHANGEAEKQPIIFINPQIIDSDSTQREYEEGCLSIPDIRAKLKRPETIQVQAQDVNGDFFTISLSGLASTCFQHEFDHLKGVLFIDHLSLFKRTRIRNKLLKQARQKKPIL